MSTYFLAVGINHYEDQAYPNLSCCEEDADELLGLFKRGLKVGERARKLVGAVRPDNVMDEINRIGKEIRHGDTFVFFFAGHGHQDPNHEDQFLVFPKTNAKLVKNGLTEGMLSLSALCLLTDHWVGVTRAFILDACRTLLPKGKRGAAPAVFNNEAGLAYVVSRSPGYSDHPGSGENSSQFQSVIILNATRNGQEATELDNLKRGVLSLALERSLETSLESGNPVWLDHTLLSDIEQHMRDILMQNASSTEQSPILLPPKARALLYKPDRSAHYHQIKALREHFEEQFSREAFDTPRGTCCRDTLTLLAAQGLPSADQQRLQTRLQAAIDQQQRDRQETAWAALLSGFERQFQAGQLDSPSGHNCRETLLLLRTASFPANQLENLSGRLDKAIADRQETESRLHDEKLITLARQHAGTPLGKVYAMQYLASARLHGHDDEARSIILAAEAAAEALAADARDEAHDAVLLKETEAAPSIGQWQRCQYLARTENLRTKAKKEIDALVAANESERAEKETRDQARLQRAIDTNSLEGWEECLVNAETPAIKETARSRLAALQAKQAADKVYDAQLLSEAEKEASVAAWEKVAKSANNRDLKQRAEQEIARIRQVEADALKNSEEGGRDQQRLQKALDANTLSAWRECLDNAETPKLRETAKDKIATLEATAAHDDQLVAEAERFNTSEAWENVFRKAKQEKVRNRARQEISRIAAVDDRAARLRDEQRAAANPDKAAPLAYWRKLQAEMETTWGKNLASEAIETLIANDQSAWNKAAADNTLEAYREYLCTQPEGKWREKAQQRIDDLAPEPPPNKTLLERVMIAVGALLFRGARPNKTPLVWVMLAALLGLGIWWVNHFTPKPLPAPPAHSAAPTVAAMGAAEAAALPKQPLPDISAWEAQREKIQKGSWWQTTPLGTAGKMSDDEKAWLRQTIQLANSDSPVPAAQLMLASLYCRGIAAPLLARDMQACGKMATALLTNPQFPEGAAGKDMEGGIGRLFDQWVPPKGEVSREFAQAIAPGLAVRKGQAPELGLRFALVQACYLQPVDRAGAIKTLNAIKATATGDLALSAASMLKNFGNGESAPSLCND